MARVTAFEAKTRFGELLERVAKGEEVVITRHDRPVARLVPEGAPRLDEVRRSADGLRELQQRIRRRTRARLQQPRGAGGDRARPAVTRSFVADASVAIGWVHPGQATPETAAMLDALAEGATLDVPALWPLEVANALIVLVRRGRLRHEEREAALVKVAGRVAHPPRSTRWVRWPSRGCRNWPPLTTCRSTTPPTWSSRSAAGWCSAARTVRFARPPSAPGSVSGRERAAEDDRDAADGEDPAEHDVEWLAIAPPIPSKVNPTCEQSA